MIDLLKELAISLFNYLKSLLFPYTSLDESFERAKKSESFR